MVADITAEGQGETTVGGEGEIGVVAAVAAVHLGAGGGVGVREGDCGRERSEESPMGITILL